MTFVYPAPRPPQLHNTSEPVTHADRFVALCFAKDVRHTHASEEIDPSVSGAEEEVYVKREIGGHCMCTLMLDAGLAHLFLWR